MPKLEIDMPTAPSSIWIFGESMARGCDVMEQSCSHIRIKTRFLRDLLYLAHGGVSAFDTDALLNVDQVDLRQHVAV